MTKVAQKVLEQALRLNPVERAELIEDLVHSFDKDGDVRSDSLWAEEAESRLDAYESGKIQADSAQEVLSRISRR